MLLMLLSYSLVFLRDKNTTAAVIFQKIAKVIYSFFHLLSPVFFIHQVCLSSTLVYDLNEPLSWELNYDTISDWYWTYSLIAADK